MIRFAELENRGLTTAVLSEKIDGDFSAEHTEAVVFPGEGSQPLVCVRQVHGNKVVRVGVSKRRGDVLPDADALVTNLPGVPLCIRVADCVPVYLFDPQTLTIGLAHAGREGTRLGVSSETLKVMTMHYGVKAADVHVQIGPSAGPCCYEVSEDIAIRFETSGGVCAGRMLDLWRSNAQQLQDVGVPKNQIYVSGICTICDGRFHSYRADATTGRNVAIAMI